MKNQYLDTIMEVLGPPSAHKPWHGGPTFLGALRGVKADQAAWTPTPDRKSIWELALHIAYWNYAVRRYFDPEAPKNPAVAIKLPCAYGSVRRGLEGR